MPLAGLAGGRIFAWTLVPHGHFTTRPKLGGVISDLQAILVWSLSVDLV